MKSELEEFHIGQGVTIVMPCYNCSRFLDKALCSVLAQTYKNWEVIIVDDCSTDNSASIAQSFVEASSRIRLIKLKKNSGAAISRNIAIKAAAGRFIAFLDSDDLWMPEKLEKQVNFMLDNEIEFSFSSYEKISEDGVSFDTFNVPARVIYNQLLKTNIIGCLTAMYDVSRLGKIYMPNDTKREDFATWLHILKKIDYAYGLADVLAQYRVYATQNSAQKILMAKENWRVYRNIEGFNLLKSAYYFSHYAVRGLLRTKFPLLARAMGVLD